MTAQQARAAALGKAIELQRLLEDLAELDSSSCVGRAIESVEEAVNYLTVDPPQASG